MIYYDFNFEFWPDLTYMRPATEKIVPLAPVEHYLFIFIYFLNCRTTHTSFTEHVSVPHHNLISLRQYIWEV